MEDKIKKVSNEYAENMMQAMDTIIQDRLNKLSFDRTITGKIISQDEKDDNLYWISTETMKFQARASGNQKYSKDEEVYVLIPEGNYDNEKAITGSRVNNIEKAYNQLRYISTKTNFVEHNILDLSESLEIKTNGGNNTKGVVYTQFNKFKYNLPIEQLGVSFKLNTLELFQQEKVEQSGQYAISIEFFDNSENELYKKINGVSEYTIYSTELTGNPYAFDENFTHFMLLPFAMEDITQIQKIKIKFIQFNDFDNPNISIVLSNVQLHFGFEKGSENIGKSQLILPSGGNNIYQTNRYFDKTLYLQWIHGNKIYNYLNLPNSEDIDYEIDVFRYQDGYGNKGYYQDDEGESAKNINQKLWNWYRVIDSNKTFEINIRLARPSMPYYNYKTIVRYKINGEENWSYVEIPQFKFTSNTNTQPPVTVSSSGLKFTFLPGDNGIYDFYSSNGRATDSSLINKTYQITVSLAEDDSDYSLWKEIKPTVTWKYLEDAMLIDVRQEDNVLSYRLASSRFQSNMKLECEVEYLYNSNKVKLNGQVDLQFGDFKSSGTNYSFNIHFDKIVDDLPIPTKLTPSEDGDIIKVAATLKKYVDVNNYVSLDIDKTNLKWEWAFPNENEAWKCSIPNTLQILNSQKVEYNINTYPEEGPQSLSIYLKYTGTRVPEKNYGILKATLNDYQLENGITTKFVDYLIIPIGLPDFSAITGPSELIYKSLSTEIERLQTTKYGLYPLDNQGEYNNNTIVWQLNNEDANEDAKAWGGSGDDAKFKLFDFAEQVINEAGENETIKRYSLNYPDYAPTTLPQVGIYTKAGSQILWSQSILVIQNTWSNQWINNWDGDLTLDEDNNVVAARSIVAGSKNGLNQFTGVKVGYAPGKQIEEYTGSGIYGYKQGINMFRLTDQGELFIGDTNNSIKFDDQNGLVINADLKVTADKIDINIKNGFVLQAGEQIVSKPKLELYNNSQSLVFGYDGTQDKATIAGFEFYGGNGGFGLKENGTGLWFKPKPASSEFYIHCSKDSKNYFSVSANGRVYAQNAEITGIINANSGKANKWSVYGLNTDGSLKIDDPKGELGTSVPIAYSTGTGFGIYSNTNPIYITADNQTIHLGSEETAGITINTLNNYVSILAKKGAEKAELTFGYKSSTSAQLEITGTLLTENIGIENTSNSQIGYLQNYNNTINGEKGLRLAANNNYSLFLYAPNNGVYISGGNKVNVTSGYCYTGVYLKTQNGYEQIAANVNTGALFVL